MPWSGTCMEQRARFVLEAQRGLFSMTELCERYGVSRKTGYKWLERYGVGGLAALADQSRSARVRPNATASELVARLIEERSARPTWGPRKLRARLRRLHPELPWPSASTIGAILNREGLVKTRVRRARSRVVWQRPRTAADAPNRVWSADFKGEFRLGNGELCYPLTIMDGHSRFLLRCHGLRSTAAAGAREIFDDAFREYGLPEVIRTDNGTPFSSPTALQGLSRLAVRWIKLGIRLERSRPAKPQDNGSHERMHRTLKDETTRPAKQTEQAQQRCFDDFRTEYNAERPHEALGDATPSDRYSESSRRLPNEVPEPSYPEHWNVRCVTKNGEMKWRQRRIFVSLALAHETVAVEELGEGQQAVYFGPILLGRFHEDRPSLLTGTGS